ncbi:MAG TPA: ATP-binding cassette domain-containing protein [Anaerolineales bacterium]
MNVELIGIHKSFGAVHANDDIHLKVPAGTVQGILGENGAGKSTLMKVLSGFIQADRGQILLDGQEVHIHSPADAIQVGIGMLHQDPLDFPPMKVIDNFLVGSQGKNFLDRIFPKRNEVIRAFQELQQEFDFSIDPETYVDSLTVGERQQLEILRLLWLGARVLILDEPTTGISALQKAKLFATLKRLAAQGKTILFVSHKLEDVEQLCSRVAVLRRGKLVGEAEPPYNIDQLVTLMFGKPISLGSRKECSPGEPVIELVDVSIEDNRLLIDHANLKVCGGEVIGLAGMEGSGQLAFLRACAGLVRPVGGKVLLGGKDFTGKNFHAFMRSGAAYLPASRMEEGLIPGLSLTDHFILAGEQRGLLVDREIAHQVTKDRISEFNIRGTPSTPVESLSGGNQQRALLALMNTALSLVLMEHPTRGLDVESSIYIWSKLKERCRLGAGIIFISSDLEEILHYSDRILVFFAGKVSQSLPASSTTVEQLGQLIGGKGW